MERMKITIDGTHFSTIEEFYNEMDKLLTKNLTWKTGHNMDAFRDLLCGGFWVHEYGVGIDFCWINADKSRKDFGYEATKLYWEQVLKKCHPSNREHIRQKIEVAERGEGKTLFDIIIEIILDKESVYDHSLILD